MSLNKISIYIERNTKIEYRKYTIYKATLYLKTILLKNVFLKRSPNASFDALTASFIHFQNTLTPFWQREVRNFVISHVSNFAPKLGSNLSPMISRQLLPQHLCFLSIEFMELKYREPYLMQSTSSLIFIVWER